MNPATKRSQDVSAAYLARLKQPSAPSASRENTSQKANASFPFPPKGTSHALSLTHNAQPVLTPFYHLSYVFTQFNLANRLARRSRIPHVMMRFSLVRCGMLHAREK